MDNEVLLRERQRRALPTCNDCHGEGTVTYTAHNRHGEVEVACACLTRADVEPPAFPQRYRVSAFGGVVASDSGRYLHVEDVLQYLRELNVEVPCG